MKTTVHTVAVRFALLTVAASFGVSSLLGESNVPGAGSPPAGQGTPPAEGSPETAPAEAPAAAEKVEPPPKILHYNRPKGSGSVAGRQSGGTRGSGEKLPLLAVLAPDHIALTTQAQPALFWYQSEPSDAAFQITLTEPKKSKPLLSVTVDKAGNAGICNILLRKQGVTLEPGVSYKWCVILIPDRANRSRDFISTGEIKRIPVPAGLDAKLESATPAEKAVLYAEAGIWYDALQSITVAIAADPKSPALHSLRASLLAQAGLKEAAAADGK